MYKMLGFLLVILLMASGCIIVYSDKPAADNQTQGTTAGAGNQSGNVQAPLIQPPAEKTLILNMLAGESGSLIKSAATYMKSNMVCAGDTDANFASRAFLSYDITSLPHSVSISQATLVLNNYAVIGSPTYQRSNWGNMGALEFYSLQYGSSGDMGRLDYESTAPELGSIRLNSLTAAPLAVDVTQDNSGNNVIQQLLMDGAARCQFRVQFFTSTNWDSRADLICLDGMILKITYAALQ